MNNHTQLSQKNAGLVAAICGSLLIAMPLSTLPGLAQINQNPGTCPQASGNRVLPGRDLTPNSIVQADTPTTSSTVLNPRPSIFNEPPYNRAVTPVTTPAVSPVLPAQTKPPMQPPLPENRSQPIAKVMPMDGKVNVKLKNNTNALITYEAIGYTQRRSLPGGEEAVLRLPVPVTITTVRQDNGLVDVIPVAPQQGMLEVSLNESKNLDDNAGALRIQKDGQVFLN